MYVAGLWNAGARGGPDGQAIPLDDGHPIEMVGEDARREQSGQAGADHNRLALANHLPIFWSSTPLLIHMVPRDADAVDTPPGTARGHRVSASSAGPCACIVR